MKTAVTIAALGAAAAHTRDTFHPGEFRAVGSAPANGEMVFTAALPKRDFAQLDAKLADISDPKSVNYGKWMSQQEVGAMIAPDPAIRAEVAAWLAANGASCIDWPSSLRCRASVFSVENMFNTKITAYEHLPRNRTIYRVAPAERLKFPAHLTNKLLFVTSVFDFPTRRMRLGSGIQHNGGRHLRKARSLQGADYYVALETLWSMYGTNTVPGDPKSITAPAEFQADQAILPADQKQFATANGVPDWTIAKKTGPFSGSDTEATLDEEYIASVGYGSSGTGKGNTQWYWTENDWMYEWTEALAAAPALPGVFSVSWGWSEGDQCTVDPGQGPCTNPGGSAAYVAACNQGFAAATARGVTILVASGDSGAHGRTDPSCSSPKTRPDWPAASPYILSVGATQIQNGQPIANPTTPVCKSQAAGGDCAGSGTEITCSTATGALIVSGGGFSNVASQPTWQTAAVKAYLASGAKLPGAKDYNATGRAYPDVAALGHNVVIYQSGPLPVDGTSCAAPIFGAVIGLANAARLAAGKAVLGYANQAIYQVAASTSKAFTDITKGDNSCTENGCVTGCTGFGATKSWDATTGWGTPNVKALVDALAAL